MVAVEQGNALMKCFIILNSLFIGNFMNFNPFQGYIQLQDSLKLIHIHRELFLCLKTMSFILVMKESFFQLILQIAS